MRHYKNHDISSQSKVLVSLPDHDNDLSNLKTHHQDLVSSIGGGAMKEPAWEKCQYYSRGHCPQHPMIDKAYLIPQLLDASQMQFAKKICEDCGKHLSENRKYQRVKRLFKFLSTKQEPEKRFEESLT